MSCEFITFHADFATGDSVHPHTTLASNSYHRMINQFFRSAQLFHCNPALSLLTTSDTRISLSMPAFRRFEISVGADTAMLDRAMAQLQLARASDFRLPMVFADSDMLINASLSELVQEDFDVALTYRRYEEMPINGGLIVLNTRRPAASLTFLDRFVTLYRQKYACSARWFGDQLALRDMINLPYNNFLALRDSPIVECLGCRVLLLNCEEYNYSPDNAFWAISSPSRHAKVLHFKGQRKRLMDYYWAAYLQPRAEPSIASAYSAMKARIAIQLRATQEWRRSRYQAEAAV